MILALLACTPEPEWLQVDARLTPDFKSSIVLLDQGLLTVGDLHLTDAAGNELGRIPGEHQLDLLGDSVEIEGATLAPEGWFELRGEILEASFSGAVLVQSGELPFELELEDEADGRIFGGELSEEFETEPSEIEVFFDGLLALSFVEWTEKDTDGDGVLTNADANNGEALAFGLRSGLSWAADLQDLP